MMEKYGVSQSTMTDGRQEERARLMARFQELARVSVKTAEENKELSDLSSKLRFFDLELDKKTGESG